MQHNKNSLALIVGAIGVVYGDIGTSPLYTLRECFHAAGLTVNALNIMGILSLITWSLLITVTFKYVMVMMKADNRGEGGILALTALALDQFATRKQRMRVLTLGLIGAALFYGDALITPAISVLSAMEGLKVINPATQHLVVPLSIVLLGVLFSLQYRGTHTVGQLFGPVMLMWFGTLGVLGLAEIINSPSILQALNPWYGAQFILQAPGVAFITMGAVVLAITGAEALYADMGHFGRKPIQTAWFSLVFPCLLLNYFGQGALLLRMPEALSNPFYMLVPQGLQLPMVFLATAATIIASQAVISGAFSLTQQAIQLGYLPRMDIRHTNAESAGQIYLPVLNWLMCGAIILLVLGFHTSSNLASAYGIAVTGTMLAGTCLSTLVLRSRNGWAWASVLAFVLVMATVDITFFSANLHKVMDGGWFPLVTGGLLFFIMHTWLRGREEATRLIMEQTPLLDALITTLDPTLPKVRRTAVFLTSDLNHAPPALMYNLQHNGIWHTQTIVMKVSRARIPRYPASERISVHHYPHGLSTVQATYGFMEQPNVPHLLAHLHEHGLEVEHPTRLSYFLSTHTYIPSPHPVLNRWQEPLFILLDKLAHSAVSYFHIPRKQVIELGNQMEI